MGILHNSPEKAAKHLELIWNNLNDWWNEEGLQNVRREFCNNYAHTPGKPLDRISQLLGDIVKLD